MHLIMHVLFHTSPLVIYMLVLVILMLESTGIPIANNTLLLLTGALASLNHVNIWVLGIVAITGSIAGACIAYGIGLHGGKKVFRRIAAFFHIETQKVQMTEQWFQKSGSWMIFASRMTPYVRPFACFLGGISHMPFVRFFVAALSGSIIWCVALLYLGWSLGRRWPLALRLLQHYTLPTIGIVLLLIAGYIAVMVLVKRRLKHYAADADAEKQNEHQEEHELAGTK